MSTQTIRILIPSTCFMFRNSEREQTFTNVFPLLWPQGYSLLSRLHFNSTAIFSVVQTVRERHDYNQGQTNVSWVFVSILCFSLPSALMDRIEIQPLKVTKTEPTNGHPHVFLSFFLVLVISPCTFWPILTARVINFATVWRNGQPETDMIITSCSTSPVLVKLFNDVSMF